MQIGADTWIYKGTMSNGGWRERRRRIRKHRKQRADIGWSVFDFWGGDHFIVGVIAGMAARFRDSGAGYPARYTAQEWADVLTRIEAPLHTYVEKSSTGDHRPEDFDAANVAMQLFAEHWMDFWD